MPTDRLQNKLTQWLSEQRASGALKGSEQVISKRLLAVDGNGPRFELEGFGSRQFIRMNANDYLGMAFKVSVRDADDEALAQFGAGPGAVRFISGTLQLSLRDDDGCSPGVNR